MTYIYYFIYFIAVTFRIKIYQLGSISYRLWTGLFFSVSVDLLDGRCGHNLTSMSDPKYHMEIYCYRIIVICFRLLSPMS